MKNRIIKIVSILLFVLQTFLSIKSFITVSPLFENVLLPDKIFLFVAFIATVLITVALIVFIFISQAGNTGFQNDIYEDNTGRSTSKKKGKKAKQEFGQELQQQKQALLQKLNIGLEGIDTVPNLTEKVLINISKEYNIMQGIFFVKDSSDNVFRKQGAYAYYSEDELREFTSEVGLSGQVAANKKLLNISNIPDKYITVMSGLGKSSPANLLIFPVLNNNESIGVIELASFSKFDSFAEEVLMEYSVQIGTRLANLMTK